MQQVILTSFIVFVVPCGLPSLILLLYRTKWALAFVRFGFLFLYNIFFVSGYVC